MDLAEPGVLAPLIRYATRVPTGGTSLTATLSYESHDGVQRQAFSFCFDTYSSGAIPDSVLMYGPNLPADRFTSTFIERNENDPNRTYYTLETPGAVPTEFVCMPGTLVIAATSPDSTAFAMSGEWDRFTSRWQQDLGDRRIHWYVEGEAPAVTYALPALPQEVLDLEPLLVREDFVLLSHTVEDDLPGGGMQSQSSYPARETGTEAPAAAEARSGGDGLPGCPQRTITARIRVR